VRRQPDRPGNPDKRTSNSRRPCKGADGRACRLAEVPGPHLGLEWRQLRVRLRRVLTAQRLAHRIGRDTQLATDRPDRRPLSVQIPNGRPRFHA
jgi:hypothetical protein